MKSLKADALALYDSGLTVIPIRLDGSKAPAVKTWREAHTKRPSRDETAKWFAKPSGIAILGGTTSGSLEVIDFDHAASFDDWKDLVDFVSPGLVDRLPHIATPDAGHHLYMRVSSPSGNLKLAMSKDPFIKPYSKKESSTKIETRGQGGYVLSPPSPPEAHETRRVYEHVGGPLLTAIPMLTDAEREILFDAARSLNEVAEKTHEAPHPPTVAGSKRPGDDYEARTNWSEILLPHGWSIIRQRGDVIHWQRPGKDGKGISATTGHCGDKLYIFSSNAAPFDNSRAYGKFNAYGLLNHAGDYKAAAKALKGLGFGEQRQAAPRPEQAPFPTEDDAPPDLTPALKAERITAAVLEDLIDNDAAAALRPGTFERVVAMREDPAEWLLIGDVLRRKKQKSGFNAALKEYDAKKKRSTLGTGWKADLKTKTDKNGDTRIERCLFNLALILMNDDAWRGVLRFNSLANKIQPTEDVPFLRNKKKPWEDSDSLATKLWLEKNYEIRPTTNDVNEAVIYVSHEQSFNPLTDYIKGLESHEKEVLDTWLIDLFGVEDTKYTRAVGRRWMISAVARALKPGCKADCVLILEGEQGMKKSSVLSQLCPDDSWFIDGLSDFGSKDQKEEIEGKWIVELGELKGFGKELDQIKAFTSRTCEKYRPSYARFTVESPRTCIFAGTVNPDNVGYLRDVTGNRRFWPVKCRKNAPTITAEMRDRLWSEARDAFLAGEKWWIDSEETELQAAATEAQNERVEVDVWHERVATYVVGRDDVSVNEIMANIGVSLDKAGSREGQRIGRILKMLRWEKYRAPLPTRPWRYRPQGSQLDLVA